MKALLRGIMLGSQALRGILPVLACPRFDVGKARLLPHCLERPVAHRLRWFGDAGRTGKSGLAWGGLVWFGRLGLSHGPPALRRRGGGGAERDHGARAQQKVRDG